MSFPIDNETQLQFDKAVNKTEEIIKMIIEFDTHYFFHGSLLRPILESSSILTELKGIITKSVISNIDLSNCVKEIKGIISCSNLYERDMDWDIKDLVHNFYSLYNATYNMCLSVSFGFKYFIYQGGLIGDSRDFCVAHNNKVFSIEEAQQWSNWTPSQGEFPHGYIIKQKDIYSVPSYLNYSGYYPLINLGGYSCRHMLGWIDDELAFEMRPELKNQKNF